MNLFTVVLLVGAGLVPIKSTFVPLAAADQHVITLRNRSIDTREAAAMSGEFTDISANQRFIVHFSHRVSETDRALLESKGFSVESYLPNGAFLVKGRPQQAQELISAGSIDWFGAYHLQDKIDEKLNEKQDVTKLVIMLFPNEDLAATVQKLQYLGAEIEDAVENEFMGKIIAWLDPIHFTDAAGIESVRWINQWYPVEPCNDKAQWVLQTWDNGNRRIWDMGLQGQGVIGSTSDSGINTEHEMFEDSTVDINDWGDYPEHRKIVAYKPGGPTAGFGDHGGFMGYHGTHTAGTVCGDDSYWEASAPFDGLAPKSRLYFMDIASNGDFFIPADLYNLYNTPYQGNEAGQAKFTSNSWGQPGNNGYIAMSWETDNFMWENPGYLILMASGNETWYVRAPGTAKNVVTVGATNNGTGANTVAGFSGSGPMADGRVKPTIMAPGAGVTSANGGSTNSYVSYDGTSMACPAAAGATALLVQYLREGWYTTGSALAADSVEPSAALLKAMLVASADVDFSQNIMDGRIGWGRVDLDSVLYFEGDTRRLYLHDDTMGIITGEQVGYELKINSDNRSFRIAVVWTDAPPEMSAQKQLVNNLDLEVYSPSGQLYYGNNFDGNYSDNNGDPDNVNVVEVIRIRKPAAGTWSVRVKGTEIPQGPQPYAIVITGDMEYHDVNLVSSGIHVDDAGADNPNGGLDPDESAILYPVVANSGSYNASAVSATLSTDETNITLLSTTADYGDIASGGESAGEGFAIQASQSLEEDKVITFRLKVEANDGGYVRTLTYSLIAGLGVDETSVNPTLSLELMQTQFTDHIGIRLSVPREGPLTLQMFDPAGRLLKTLLDEGSHPAGTYEYEFAATDNATSSLSNGVYFLRLKTAQNQIVSKTLLLR
jgi:hypothetical protein